MGETKARQLALELMYRWNLLPEWGFRFNKSVFKVGACVFPSAYGRGRIELSTHFCRLNPDNVVREAVLHEIAHALSGEAEHGKSWSGWCHKLGIEPRVYANASMPPGRWNAGCQSCGTSYNRHRRPDPSRHYFCTCGSPLLLTWRKT